MNLLEAADDLLARAFKIRKSFRVNRFGRGKFDFQCIYLNSIPPKPITQMRAGGQPRASYITDGLPLVNVITRMKSGRNFVHVQVLGGVHTVVSDLYIVAVIAIVSGFQNHTITYAPDRSTGGRGKIGTTVRAEHLGNGMKASGIIP